MTSRGNGYLASPSMQTSTANQEIIERAPKEWTQGYRLYKFSFNNTHDCVVKINNTTTAFLIAGQGFEMERGDAPITSFVIVDDGVVYNWFGAF